MTSVKDIGSVSGRHTARQSTACVNCRQRKRKCNGKQPCSTCSLRKVECLFRADPDRRRLRAKQSQPQCRGTNFAGDLLVNSEDHKAGSSTTSSTNMNEGEPAFGLTIDERGSLEYRGPTSSTTGSIPLASNDTNELTCDNSGASALLPDRAVLDHHLNLFLEWQNSQIIIVVGLQADELFRCCADDYATKPGIVLLLLSILALTSSFSRQATNTDTDAYFKFAKELLLQSAFSKPSIEVVQAAAILACREYGHGHENGAWTLNGIAATTGTILGLHVLGDASRWLKQGRLTEDDVNRRISTYWATVVIDRILATCLGRHCLIHPTDFTTPTIRLRSPLAQTLKTGRSQVLTFGSPEYEQNVLQTFQYSVDFWKFNDRSLSEIYDFRHDISGLRADSTKRQQVLERLGPRVTAYRLELQEWYASLPNSIKGSYTNPTPHTLLLDMAYHNLMILLHRPFINWQYSRQQAHDANWFDQMEMECLNYSTIAAHCITQGVKSMKIHYRLDIMPFSLTHFLLTASTIHAVKEIRDGRAVAYSTIQDLDTNLEALEEISRCWPVASKAIWMIQNLRDALANPISDQLGGTKLLSGSSSKSRSSCVADMDEGSMRLHTPGLEAGTWFDASNEDPPWDPDWQDSMPYDSADFVSRLFATLPAFD